MGDMDDGFYPDGVEKAEWSGMKRGFARKLTVSDLIKDPWGPDDCCEKTDLPEEVLFDVIAEYLGDEVFARRFVECMEIIRRKNADYSQGEQKQDRIAAFKRIARDIGVPVRKAWAVFAQKHWGAVMRYVKDGFVDSEPINGRINDMINYLVLFGAIVDWEGTEMEAEEA